MTELARPLDHLAEDMETLRRRLAQVEADKLRAEAALRQSEARFRAFMDNSPCVAFLKDAAGRHLYGNVPLERLLARSRADMLGKTDHELFAAEIADRLRQNDAAVLATGQPTEMVEVVPNAAGELRSWLVMKFPVPDEALGRLLGGVAVDITERQQTEQALRRSEEEFRAMFELAGVGKGQGDPATGRFLHVNRKMCAITGYTADELRGMTFMDITHPDDRLDDSQGFQRLVRGEVNEYAVEKRYVRKDGSTVWVHVTVTAIRDATGRPLRTLAVIQDITARRQAEEQLQDYASRLQELSRRLLEVQEQERRHFARELHDEVGQALTGLGLTLEAVSRLPTEELRDGLARAQALAKETTAQVRELSLRLRPSMLDDLGLRPALLWYFARYTAQTGLPVQFDPSELKERLPAAVETAAYRIVQEALTNVARHASARNVAVRLWREGDTLILHVTDDGRGFDQVAVRATKNTSGLSGMHERALLLGGGLTIVSRPREGTRLTAVLPIPRVDGSADCRNWRREEAECP
jgi:PAS domain S-box-containing protein